MNINDLLVHEGDSFRAVVAALDRPGPAIAIAVSDDGVYRGLVDAASIERAIALGQGLDAPVIAAIHMDDAGFVPALDGARRPVGYKSPSVRQRIPVSEPSLSGNELTYVTECIETRWISSQGPFVRRFEAEIAARLGVAPDHVLAVSNGTVALHLALVALGVGPGDEVIVPDLTFAATINTVIQAGATPVLVDVDRASWNIDPAAAAALVTSRTKAIIPVHLYGQPADMDALLRLAKRHDLCIIEDAAEAMGSRHGGRPCGAIGDAGTFSFFSNKLITTGEGGAVVFRDSVAAQRARMLRDHGMDPKKRYWHLEVGFNYRLTNLQAALGCAQIEQLDAFLARKVEIAQAYKAKLDRIPGVTLPAAVPDFFNSFWAYSTIIDFAPLVLSRDEFMVRLGAAGIETRPLFYPLHEMPPYRQFAGNRDFPITSALSANGISLPSAVVLSPSEIDYIGATIERQLAARQLARRVGIA